MSGSMQTGSGTPIVTEGAAGSRQPYGDFFSAYERMQQLRQPQSSGGFFDFSPAQQSALDRLGALGAAMASTRSPTFAGALGEGLQAMQRTAAGQRQEERQNRQLDVEAAYRAAQEARQMAEFEYARNPENPLNQLRVAQTRQAEAQAQAALMNARTSAATAGTTARLGTGREVQMPDGTWGMIYPGARGGPQFVPYPQGAVPAGQLSNEERLRQADMANYATTNRNNPIYQMDPSKLMADAAAHAETQAEIRRRNRTAGQPQQPATTTAPAETTTPNIQRRPF